MRFVFAGTTQLSAAPRVAVVIDVMRAFTTSAYAFAGGTEKTVFAETDTAALELKARHPHWLAVRDGAPAAGFDFSNSPGQTQERDLTGRSLVLRTTSGTAGALAVAEAEVILCASFVVARSTATYLRSLAPEEVVFVITGQNGRAEEDLACARYIAESITTPDADPSRFIERARRSEAATDLVEGVRRGYREIHRDDLRLCLEADKASFAMTATPHSWGMVLARVVA
ncbi:2-phosphosulfolactate phosphatase [Nocardia thailandica]|uniref:Probable 2-phosphosulfolactate phosphatase n=1 Tax=Nocardia thailandica TaxID=257275 RepID=A0ABW6PIB0_9NOCA